MKTPPCQGGNGGFESRSDRVNRIMVVSYEKDGKIHGSSIVDSDEEVATLVALWKDNPRVFRISANGKRKWKR